MKQAKRGFANAVLYEGDDISDWNAMYDTIAINFPDLRGFTVEEIRSAEDAFANATSEVEDAEYPTTSMDGKRGHYVLKNSNNETIKAVNELLRAGKKVGVTTSDGKGYSKGDYVVHRKDLQRIKDTYYLEVGPLKKKAKIDKLSGMSKVAVVGSGASRFVIEQLGFEITSVEEADVIVDDSGRVDKEKITEGTSYIGIGGRALQAVKQSELLEGFDFERTNFSHEGLLKTTVKNDSFVTAGYGAEEIFYGTTGS